MSVPSLSYLKSLTTRFAAILGLHTPQEVGVFLRRPDAADRVIQAFARPHEGFEELIRAKYFGILPTAKLFRPVSAAIHEFLLALLGPPDMPSKIREVIGAHLQKGAPQTPEGLQPLLNGLANVFDSLQGKKTSHIHPLAYFPEDQITALHALRIRCRVEGLTGIGSQTSTLWKFMKPDEGHIGLLIEALVHETARDHMVQHMICHAAVLETIRRHGSENLGPWVRSLAAGDVIATHCWANQIPPLDQNSLREDIGVTYRLGSLSVREMVILKKNYKRDPFQDWPISQPALWLVLASEDYGRPDRDTRVFVLLPKVMHPFKAHFLGQNIHPLGGHKESYSVMETLCLTDLRLKTIRLLAETGRLVWHVINLPDIIDDTSTHERLVGLASATMAAESLLAGNLGSEPEEMSLACAYAQMLAAETLDRIKDLIPGEVPLPKALRGLAVRHSYCVRLYDPSRVEHLMAQWKGDYLLKIAKNGLSLPPLQPPSRWQSGQGMYAVTHLMQEVMVALMGDPYVQKVSLRIKEPGPFDSIVLHPLCNFFAESLWLTIKAVSITQRAMGLVHQQGDKTWSQIFTRLATNEVARAAQEIVTLFKKIGPSPSAPYWRDLCDETRDTINNKLAELDQLSRNRTLPPDDEASQLLKEIRGRISYFRLRFGDIANS